MDISDIGYAVVMAVWAGLVVLLSYRLGYDNGRWAWVEEESRNCESGKQKQEELNFTEGNGGNGGKLKG